VHDDMVPAQPEIGVVVGRGASEFPASEPNVAELVSSAPARRGTREEIFEQLFHSYYDRAVRFSLLAGARDHFHAREIATDAIARVWSRWRLGGVDDFWPYLRVAIVNDLRSQARRKRVADRYQETQLPPPADIMIDLTIVERDEIAAAIERLAPRHRLVLMLRFFEDLSTEQTARVMRCSVGTVKSTTSRALSAMRDVLEEQADE
jgi:RNA polymerase sigma factor (sigma-70 family)